MDKAVHVHNLDALTGIRFFAALAVFNSHFLVPEKWLQHVPDSVLSLRNGLVCSVFVFFMLSGFILTIAYKNMETGAVRWAERKKFWIARFARIYPVYLLSLLWFAPVMVVHRFAVETPRLALEKTASSWFASMFLVQSWISDRFGRAWNGPTWTLSIEAGFYLMFPWLLRWIGRLPVWGLWVLGGVLMVLGGVDATTPAFLGSHASNPVTMLPLFGLGIIAATLYQRSQQHSAWTARLRVLPVPSFVLGCVVIMVGPGPGRPGAVMGLLLCLCMMGLVYGLALQGWPGRLLSTKPMMLLGEASYSFYLLQLPVYFTLFWLKTGFPRADLMEAPRDAMLRSPVGFVVLLLVLQGVSIAVFWWLERPMRIYLRDVLGRWFVHRPLPLPAEVGPGYSPGEPAA
jgi:peptidoglycan/LPS O-acetylase OafA/YrhL